MKPGTSHGDHSECCLDENCGGDDCPPAVTLRRRAAARGVAWHPLHLDSDGGPRHSVAGEPVHCGDLLELQEREEREDDFGSYVVLLPRGVVVRYEATLRGGTLAATLHKRVAGHPFVARVEAWMRFRWPVRS